MEPPLKRLRIFEPGKSEPGVAYDSDNYTDLDDNDDYPLEVEEDGQEEEEGNDSEQGDPDVQLERTRARLDLKLKSKFEAIFEKYGRDFTGIGDEIDLRTGEIIVDNGHLLEMEDERDDGTGRPSLLEAFTQEPDDSVVFTEAENDEQDELHESHVQIEDMEEDDMILFQNPVTSSRRPETPPPRSDAIQDLESDQQEASKMTTASRAFPSESEILAQFGKDLGPKIARYVSQQRAQDDTAIEPAWRTPGLPLATPGKRPILKSILFQPDSDRSPSPKGSSSVWAPKKPRGRPRRDGADVAAIFRGETIIRDRTWYTSGYVSTTVTKQRTERVGLSQSKRTMSVPLNESLTGGDSNLEPNSWTQSRQTESGDLYGIDDDIDQELDSSEEKAAKFYKPRRSWSNSALSVKQRIPGKLKPQSIQPRHRGKDGISVKRSHVLFTEADDNALLEWVEEALKRGYTLWSTTHWKMLAEKNPRHSHGSWMTRYHKRFWQRGLVPSVAEKDSGKSLKPVADDSEAVPLVVCDSQTNLGECSFSDERSYEMLQDTPSTGSGNVPGNFLIPNGRDEDSKVDFIDIEALDPALRPPMVEDVTKEEKPNSLWQQRSSLSQSDAVDFKRGASLPCVATKSMTSAERPRSNSVPQTVRFKVENPALPIPEIEVRTHRAVNIGTDGQKVVIECDKTTSGDRNHLNPFLSDAGMKMKGAKTSQGGPMQQQITQKPFGSSYDFSDEEEDAESVPPGRPFRLQVPDAITSRHPVEKHIIDLTADDSDHTTSETYERRAYKCAAFNQYQTPIHISSSSSSASDLSELEEEQFFLEPFTPKVSISDSNARLSSILGSDDFEELRKSSPVSSKQSPQGNITVPDSQGFMNRSSNEAKASWGRNSTPKTRRGVRTAGASVLTRSMEASPSGPLIETPGGSKGKCGENGFRCGRGFCFRCLEG